ncbi:MerR family transcriptional regulator [Paenibacillus lautus]|uniref:MerR family transcriptional regulator n=1 Tax=Paenibacillus lautus TaxID=1401 RepID=UPI003D2BD3D0
MSGCGDAASVKAPAEAGNGRFQEIKLIKDALHVFHSETPYPWCAGRHRFYRKEDIYRIKQITCLKKTGMSLEAMRPFLAASVDSDSVNYPELVDQLRSQREHIMIQISSLQQIVDFIDIKLKEGRPQ